MQAVAKACDVRIAPNYPVVGADAFRTATGVHAAAVVKAFRKGDRALMDAVYAAVPASLVGRQQEIEVGPMSGTLERDLLAREPRAAGDRRDRRSHLRRRQGVEPDADARAGAEASWTR